MFDLFGKIDKFIADARNFAKGAVTKGTKILRELADWLETEVAPPVSAPKPSKKPDQTKAVESLETYEAELESLKEELEAPRADGKPSKFDPTVVIVIVQAIQALLKAIAERRKKQAPDSE